jgi:hypothetical protein
LEDLDGLSGELAESQQPDTDPIVVTDALQKAPRLQRLHQTERLVASQPDAPCEIGDAQLGLGTLELEQDVEGTRERADDVVGDADAIEVTGATLSP